MEFTFEALDVDDDFDVTIDAPTMTVPANGTRTLNVTARVKSNATPGLRQAFELHWSTTVIDPLGEPHTNDASFPVSLYVARSQPAADISGQTPPDAVPWTTLPLTPPRARNRRLGPGRSGRRGVPPVARASALRLRRALHAPHAAKSPRPRDARPRPSHGPRAPRRLVQRDQARPRAQHGHGRPPPARAGTRADDHEPP